MLRKSKNSSSSSFPRSRKPVANSNTGVTPIPASKRPLSEQPLSSKGHSSGRGLTKRKEPEVITVNIDDIRTRLDRLHNVAHKQIRSLSGAELEDYQALVRSMRLLWDTDVYRVFHDEVRNKFADIPSSTVEPGTIAAFFVGCVVTPATANGGGNGGGNRSSHDTCTGCSPVCAGSMPAPPAAGSPSGFCPHTVAIAHAKENGYEIKILYESENKDEMLVHLDTRGKEFTGFNEDEKAQLAKYNCAKIKVVKYHPDTKTSTEVAHARLQELPTRADTIQNPISSLMPSGTSRTGSSGLFWVLLIILVLVAIFVGWRITTTKQV